MADKDYGSGVSRYLDPSGRAFETVVYQEQKPVLDSELNLDQDVRSRALKEMVRSATPSGFLTGDFLEDEITDWSFGSAPNTLTLGNRPIAVVNGWVLPLEHTLGKTERGTAVEPFDFSSGLDYDVEINGVQVTGTLTTANTLAADVATDWQTQIEADSTLSGGSLPANDFRVYDNADGSVTIEGRDTILVNDAGSGQLEEELGLSTVTPASGENEITLPDPPVVQGAEAMDFVFLEVWRALVSAENTADEEVNKPAADKLYPNGNTLAKASAWIDDDLWDADPAINRETTARVQIQHALRVVRLDSKSNRLGYDDPNVVAQGPNSTLTTESFAADIDDSGLWVAGGEIGSGSEIAGTADGFVYSVPVAMVWRGNTDGFEYLNNGAGGAFSSSGASDRPDGRYADRVYLDDVQDMRSGVSLASFNFEHVLDRNLSLLMDQSLRSWATDSAHTNWDAAGTNVGTRFLKADDLIPSTPVSDPPSGNTFRRADGVCRLFSDRCRIERHVVRYEAATWASGGTWSSGDTVTLDFEASSSIGAPIADEMPDATMVVDVAAVKLDDVSGAGGQLDIPINQIDGLGNTHLNGGLTVDVTIDTPPIAGSSRDIWVEYEVAYPQGGGLTSHVTEEASNFQVLVHNPSAFNSDVNPPSPFTDDEAGRQAIREYLHLEFEAAHRELRIEYHPHDAVTLQVYSEDDQTIVIPERLWENAPSTDAGVVSVTEDPGGLATAHTVDAVATSGRTIKLSSSLSSDGELVEVEFYPVRALPINGAALTIYYRTAGLQAIPAEFLPSPLSVRPVQIAEHLFVGTMSSGASPTPYPYEAPLNQIPSSTTGYAGEHHLDSPADLSIDDFSSSSGFVRLPVLMPPAPVDAFTFEGPLNVQTENDEFVDYYTGVDTNSYRPTAFAQNLSGAVRHKAFLPVLARLEQDTPFGRAGSLVMVVLASYVEFDEENGIAFTSSGETCAAVYKIKGNILSYGV